MFSIKSNTVNVGLLELVSLRLCAGVTKLDSSFKLSFSEVDSFKLWKL